MSTAAAPLTHLPPAEAWWHLAFPRLPYTRNAPGEKEMLSLIAYDIADSRRLSRVARICADYGVRVQYSLFECRLEEDELDTLWRRLLKEIDEREDRLVAYKIDARCARDTLTAGTMVCSEKVVCYVV